MQVFFYIYRQVENILGIGLPERAVAGTPRAPHCNKRVKFDRYPALMNSNLFERSPYQQKEQKYYKCKFSDCGRFLDLNVFCLSFLLFPSLLTYKVKPKKCSGLTNLVDWDLKQL